MKDYYYILGISKDASKEEIKFAFRKLSLKFHPDQNNGEKFFEKQFIEILEAYEILFDDFKRKEYNEIYNSWINNKNDFDHEIFKTFWESHKEDIEAIKEKIKKVKTNFEKQKENLKETLFDEDNIKIRESKAKQFNKRILLTFLWLFLFLVIIYIFYYALNSKNTNHLIQKSKTTTYLKSDNNFNTKKSQYEKCMKLAKIYYDKLDCDNSIIEFQKAIFIMPNSAEAYLGLGKAQYRNRLSDNRLYDKAILNLNKSIEIKHDYAEAYYFLGLIYYFSAVASSLAVSLMSEDELLFNTTNQKIYSLNKSFKIAKNKALLNTKRALKFKPEMNDAIDLLNDIHSLSFKP